MLIDPCNASSSWPSWSASRSPRPLRSWPAPRYATPFIPSATVRAQIDYSSIYVNCHKLLEQWTCPHRFLRAFNGSLFSVDSNGKRKMMPLDYKALSPLQPYQMFFSFSLPIHLEQVWRGVQESIHQMPEQGGNLVQWPRQSVQGTRQSRSRVGGCVWSW